MPHIRLVDPRASFGESLRSALAYPLRGAALASVVVLALAHYLALLPLGFVFELIVWAVTYLYALACLRHSAEGYADPPELSSENGAAGWIIVGVLMLGMGATWAAKSMYGSSAAWAVSLTLALVLPAIVMSLAYDEGWATALNPASWLRSMALFGAPYFVLVGVQLLIAALLGPLQVAAYAALPSVLASPLFYFVATYLTLFNFHLMGALLYRHHERLGLDPEAPRLAHASRQDANDECLEQARRLQANGDALGAITLLGERLDERSAPASLHMACRTLLRARGRNDEMLVRSSRCLDALLAENDEARAIGVVSENLNIDPQWLPDGPDATGRIAYAAMHRGMTQLALKLARGIPNRWPENPLAPHFGLLAARLLSRLGRSAEAGVLAGKLVQAWPDCVERREIDQFLAALPSDAAPQ
jgi:hypothetical protein